MLWFLLTAYLCVGCYYLGLAESAVKGSGFLAGLVFLLTWPMAYILKSKQ